MLDIGWPELFLIAVVVLLVVGPKDLPKVLRNIGVWVSKAKTVTREFRTHVDDMIHESELEGIRNQINNAGDMDLKSIAEETIGDQDEVKDLLEFEMDEQEKEIPDGQLHLTESEGNSKEDLSPIENDTDEAHDPAKEVLASEKGLPVER